LLKKFWLREEEFTRLDMEAAGKEYSIELHRDEVIECAAPKYDMFRNYAGKWIPDTPGRRRVILDRLQGRAPFSNSSPVDGITQAIRTYSAPDKKISLYVLGDEFTGRSIDEVVDTVDRINKEDREGNRLVRIHAVGFPVMFSQVGFSDNTGVRFATLMHLLCEKNGGSFVGLSSIRP